jgi:UTP--glucose-1-phosphate uridylyltransferase
MGLQDATIGQLLQRLESAGMQERHTVTRAVATTFARLIERLEAPVRTAVIPAAGGQHRLLAQHVMQLLVLRTIREAVESGIGQVILILPAGLGELLYAPVKAALELAVVPPIALRYCEQARPEGLGDAILQAEAFVGEEPFAVLLPDDIVRERMGRTVHAWELRRMMEALRQVPGAQLVAVTAVPRSKMSYGGVVQVEQGESGSTLRPIVTLVEKPHPADPICRAPQVLGIVGRYLLQPAIFGPLHALQAAGQRLLHLTEALEHLRQAGQNIYAFELEGAREDLGHVLGEASALIDASTDPGPPS